MHLSPAHILLLLLFFFRASLSAFSQDPYFVTLDESDGLPSNEVYDLFQDSRGFIWIATDAGLCRYDGHSYRSYRSPVQTSLPGSNIFEDSRGRIWYQNFDGYNYYVLNDSLHALAQDSTPGYVRSGLAGDKLAIPQNHGTEFYDLSTLTRTAWVPHDIYSVHNTRRGEKDLWIFGTQVDEKFIYSPLREDRNHSSIYPKEVSGQEIFDVGGEVYGVQMRDPQGRIYQKAGEEFEPISVPGELGIIRVFECFDNKLWLCGVTGMAVFDLQSRSFNSRTPFFQDKSISAVLRDREGNLWFGTLGKGIIFVSDFESRFVHSSGVPYRRIEQVEGSLFAGTQDGEVLRFDGTGSAPAVFYKNTSHHSVDLLRYLSGENQFWIGDPLAHVTSLSTTANAYSVDKTIPLAAKDVARISHKYVAVSGSSNSGFWCMDNTAGADPWDSLFAVYSTPDNPAYAPVVGGRGRAVLHIEGREEIYFAGGNGLFCVTPHQVREVKMGGQSIFASKFAPGGDLIYVLTTLGTLCVITPEGEIQPFTGLPESGFISNLKILGGKMYLVSDRSLLQVTTEGNRVLSSKIIPGVNPRQVNDMTLFGDRLILATDEGLVILNPEGDNEAAMPAFIITGLNISGKFFPAGEGAEVSYRQNEIRIDYSILSFRTGGNYPLWYRINGGGWTLTPANQRTLLLARLEPGDYQFDFSLGTLGDKTITGIHVLIRKPFWLQWWFYLLGSLLLVGFAVTLVMGRVSRLKKRQSEYLKKKELENDLRQSKLTALRSQMNPHFFFNALNTIQSYIYSGDKKDASSYLTKFSRLTRMVLEMSEKEYVTVAEEKEALTLYLELEKSRFEEPFHFSIYLEEGLDPGQLLIPSMVIQPFLENAVKHGLLHKKGPKEVHLSFRRQGDALEIRVEDNGIGRQRSGELNAIRNSKHKSFSTEATRKRVELLNRGHQQIGLEYIDKKGPDGEATGTTVILILPITRSYLKE